MFLRYTIIRMILFLSCLAMLNGSSADVPVTLKPEAQQRDPYDWQQRHRDIVQRHKTVKPDYVMIGDSLTHHWGGEPLLGTLNVDRLSWQQWTAGHIVTNMGFGYDYIDNAYYRIQQGELDGVSPKVIIVLLGTNNLGHRKDSPQTTAINMEALIRLLRQKVPNSKILLLGILPRADRALTAKINQCNQLLGKLHDTKTVFFANPGLRLLTPDGKTADPIYLRDTVHLNAQGYRILADELQKSLKKLDPAY